MPKMTERERLADLEARQRTVTEEIESARRALRGRYAKIACEVALERMSEKEFREGLNQLVRVGAAAAISALKALPAVS